MFLNSILLFLASWLGGGTVFLFPSINLKKFRTVLTFSGAYLFSVTVIHILPEIFIDADNIKIAGMYVLAGFFLQMVLEYFTSGVEHGHLHVHSSSGSHDHVTYPILIAMSLHSFLEGTMLIHPAHLDAGHSNDSLLYGLLLHKIPEAFALTTVLIFTMRKKHLALMLLLIFSFSSPLGLFVGDLFYTSHLFNRSAFSCLFAVVAGNFLYISTTIFFETSPDHQFKAHKLFISLLGAAFAIFAEYFLNR